MNLIEIADKFPDELSCIQHAEKLRWGKGIQCAYCGSRNLSKRREDHRHKCKDCNKSTSVTVNTNLHDTRLPLKTWFFAVSVITDAKKGMSALQLQRNLSVSYPTAFSMYHKLRSLMMIENKDTQELTGVVEMDETFIGGKPRKFNNPKGIPPASKPELDQQVDRLEDEGFSFEPNEHSKAKSKKNAKRGRGTDNIPVVGIVERNGDVVAQVMNTLSYSNLKKMVQKYVNAEDSVLVTDSYKGYNSMKKIIEHIKIDHKKMYSYRGVNSNTIESFWAIIERGIMGQYHSVSPKRLPNYIAEFVYRYNNRNDTEGMFDELLEKLLEPAIIKRA
jgi:transposase-like protein